MDKLPRRESRTNAFLFLFAVSLNDQPLEELLEINQEDEEHPLDDFGKKLVMSYFEHSEEIDNLISERLRNWTMKRLPKVSLAALRLAISEMLYGPEKKIAVAINEAVELCKIYSPDEKDANFVNGVLGTVVRDLKLKDDGEEESNQN